MTATTTSPSASGTFVTIPGDRHSEVARTLAEPVPQALSILALRELDQSFANVYSTAASTQNLRPLWDRRVLAITISALTTVGALFLNISDYENFLILLGSVFVPLSAVLIVDFFVLAKGHWDVSGTARTRWLMLLPWAAGFVTYQLINPGYISWWASAWTQVVHAIGFTPASWMSASICSFTVAAVATLAAGGSTALARRGGGRAGAGEHLTAHGRP